MSTVVFQAEMTCSGCSNAITNILTKVSGVTGVECDVDTKLVTVQLAAEGAADPSDLEAKLNVWAEAASKPNVVRKS